MITVLHISDLQFGEEHRFRSKEYLGTLYQRLEEDLRGLKDRYGLRPELVVVTGDLAEKGKPREFKNAYDFLCSLSRSLGISHDRVALVPGNHDINWGFFESYFKECEGSDRKPAPPFWRKWNAWVEMFNRFYCDHPSITFTEDEHWTLYEIKDLKVVVAGLNSTVAESHRDDDHYGEVGEDQVRWFAKKLKPYQERGWFRIGLVHHNPIRGAVDDRENLKDYELLRRILGPSLNVLLHGHTHNGKMDLLGRNTPIISTGSAGLKPSKLPSEIPNQYQITCFSRNKLRRYTRYFEPEHERWIGDTRFCDFGDNWIVDHVVDFQDTKEALPETEKPTNRSAALVRPLPHRPLSRFQDIDLVLEINHHWNSHGLTLDFDFHSPSGAVQFSGATTCRQPIGTPGGLQKELYGEIAKLTCGIDAGGETTLLASEIGGALDDVGHWLYDRLFPGGAREIYRESKSAAKTLLIVSEDPWIPWEIVRPFDQQDDDFLCLRFEMSRWLPGVPFPAEVKHVKRFACLSSDNISNMAPLLHTNKEMRFIESLIVGAPGVEGLADNELGYDHFLQALGGGPDLFHFAGYVQDGDVGSNAAEILLAEGRPFRVRKLSGPLAKRLQEHHPIVFLNARAGSQGGVGGWAEGWLRHGGASTFINSFWGVSDNLARVFSTSLYRELKEGRRFGDAVRFARRKLREDKPSDLSWMAYRIYGNPNGRVIFGGNLSK